jgi:AraC family transcriptional regulator, transcriptional activator of pobA
MKFSSQFRKMRNERRASPFDIHKLETLVVDAIDDEQLILSKSRHIILWVQQGTGQIAIDLDRFTITTDTLYYIRPGQALEVTLHEPARGFLFSFEGEFLPLFEKNFASLSHIAFLNNLWKRPVIHIQNEMSCFLKNIADEMLHEYLHYYDLRSEILSSFVKIFLVYLSRNCESSDKEFGRCPGSELVMLFLTMLEKHFVDKKMVKDYADSLAVTPGYLNKVVKEVTGFNASHHIQQRIVLEAKRRAIFDRNSLKEIAYILGFCDPAHFSKFFKNGAGTNFTHFKKTALNFC